MTKEFNFENYCDFCFQKTTTLVQYQCGHRFCETCIEIVEGENICPFDFKILENPNKISFQVLCQNCKKNECKIRCFQCNLELCEECDYEIHKIQIFASHERTQQLQYNNATCQGINHSKNCRKNIINNNIQQLNKEVKFYIPELNQTICEVCEKDTFYEKFSVIYIQEAYEICQKSINSLSEISRDLSKNLHQKWNKWHEMEQLNVKLFDLAISELELQKQNFLQQVNAQFQKIQQEYNSIFLKRKESINNMQEQISNKNIELSQLTISAEKMNTNREKELFVVEQGEIQSILTEKISQVQQFQQSIHLPQTNYYPELLNPLDVQMIVINENQKFIEKSTLIKTQCKKCGNILMNNELKILAKKQKGALFGVESQNIFGILFDEESGTQESRHVKCGVCMNELGRYSEFGVEQPKFTPGLIFVSKMSVK